MRITHFQRTEDGGSRFFDLDVALAQEVTDAQGFLLRGSNRYASPSVQFMELPEGLDQTWHPAPRRQLVVVLSGELEVTTTDGVSRRFGPGQLFLADDRGGRGHLTRTINGSVTVLFAPMPSEVDLAAWAASAA